MCFWSFAPLFGDSFDVAARTGSSGSFDASSFPMAAEVDTSVTVVSGTVVISVIGCVLHGCKQTVFKLLCCRGNTFGMYLVAAFVRRSNPFSNMVGN